MTGSLVDHSDLRMNKHRLFTGQEGLVRGQSTEALREGNMTGGKEKNGETNSAFAGFPVSCKLVLRSMFSCLLTVAWGQASACLSRAAPEASMPPLP